MSDIILQFANYFAPIKFPLVDYHTTQQRIWRRSMPVVLVHDPHSWQFQPQLSQYHTKLVFPTILQISLLITFCLSQASWKVLLSSLKWSTRLTIQQARVSEYTMMYTQLMFEKMWMKSLFQSRTGEIHLTKSPMQWSSQIFLMMKQCGMQSGATWWHQSSLALQTSRKSYTAWANAGGIIKYPISGKEKEAEESKIATKDNAIQFQHQVLSTILCKLFHLICSDLPPNLLRFAYIRTKWKFFCETFLCSQPCIFISVSVSLLGTCQGTTAWLVTNIQG